jgi:hypothetical protein
MQLLDMGLKPATVQVRPPAQHVYAAAASECSIACRAVTQCLTAPSGPPALGHGAAPQVQYSLIDRRPELFLGEACERHAIPLLAYGVLAGGFLSERYLGLPAARSGAASVACPDRRAALVLDVLASGDRMGCDGGGMQHNQAPACPVAAPQCSAKLDTLSKAKYGTMLRELGGWSWLQELLEVGGRSRLAGEARGARGSPQGRRRVERGLCSWHPQPGAAAHHLSPPTPCR